MFETLKRLYDNGKLTSEQLSNAVSKGWITEEQKQQILSQVN